MKNNLNITPLLEKKARHRRQMAQIPFEEKIKVVRRLQRRRAEIKATVSKDRRSLASQDR